MTGKGENNARTALSDVIKKGGWRIFAAFGLVLGIILLLIPSGGMKTPSQADAVRPTAKPGVDVAETERRLSTALSQIEGAGRVNVLLSLKNDGVTEFAADRAWEERSNSGAADKSQSFSTVIVTQNGAQSPIIAREGYPEFQGALAIAEGADNPEVKLALTRALSSFLGIGSDHIAVAKMSQQKQALSTD